MRLDGADGGGRVDGARTCTGEARCDGRELPREREIAPQAHTETGPAILSPSPSRFVARAGFNRAKPCLSDQRATALFCIRWPIALMRSLSGAMASLATPENKSESSVSSAT